MPRDTEWPPVTFERLTWLIEQGGGARRSGRGRRYGSAVMREIASAEMMLPSECALVSEDVRLDSSSPSGWKGSVEAVERLGYETLVYVDLAGDSIVARVSNGGRLSRGDAVQLGVSPAALHLFAADGEQNRID